MSLNEISSRENGINKSLTDQYQHYQLLVSNMSNYLITPKKSFTNFTFTRVINIKQNIVKPSKPSNIFPFPIKSDYTRAYK